MAEVQAPIIPIIGRMVSENPGTISLGQGIAYYGPPAAAEKAMQAFPVQPGVHRYTDVAGIPELLELVEQKLRSFNGISCSENGLRTIVTAGANMGFLNALFAITDPGDEIILSVPYYFNHEMAIRMLNCVPVLVPTDSRFHLNLDAMRERINDKTRAIVTVSPNNPSGAVYTAEELEATNKMCREAGIYHISDETYEYFVYDGTASSPAALPSAASHTISLYSLSKAYGFASWRIGYMVVPEELYTGILKAQDTNLICPPGVSQSAAAAILSEAPDYWEEKVQTLKRVRTRVLEALAELGTVIDAPQAEGAFYVLLRINNNQLDDMQLARDLITEFGVAVIPGIAFGLSQGCYLRISYGALAEDSVNEGVERLVKGIKVLTGRR
jgi:aspartate/methionine/tyrosine aminotransferase